MPETQNVPSLPPYRSLVNPNVTYDYQTHRIIHLSPLEVKTIVAQFTMTQLQKQRSKFPMKYRSLLSDVSVKALLISRKVLGLKQAQAAQLSEQLLERWSQIRCLSFKQLPMEIQMMIFSYVDDFLSYKNCLYANKTFYRLAKPFVLRSVTFTSTYRFAQFITCLRLNTSLGLLVEKVDLSKMQPGNADIEVYEGEHPSESSSSSLEVFNRYLSKVWAGWRDWKFRNNLNALHPVAIPLSKSCTSLVPSNQNHNESKRIKLSKYFKRRRSLTNVQKNSAPLVPSSVIVGQAISSTSTSSHPKINRFLLSYASSKDLPVGYIVHLVNLCPNLEELNLANVTLSTDYRIKRTFQSQYPRYDLVNNYHKDMMRIVESIGPQLEMYQVLRPQPATRADVTSSASSIFSIGSLSKPVWKYNSLLPPAHLVSPDLHYANKGDGVLFLSDLSLKSINTTHLEVVQPEEIFKCLQGRQENLKYLNMSSMIWINLKLVREYLLSMYKSLLTEMEVDEGGSLYFKLHQIEMSLIDGEKDSKQLPTMTKYFDFILDLTNSGMNKNLPWAKIINSRELAGERLIKKIINDQMITVAEENLAREMQRRGRVGENYFS